MKYDFVIRGEIFEWRGPAPFHFVRIPPADGAVIKSQARILSYGWGVIPVHGVLGKSNFETALFPKDGSYLIPIKDALRNSEGIDIGDQVVIRLNLGKINS
jgi:hypothetical protein